ncbi:MAG TPA: thiamine pyrophosphate-binding protein [Longimicrobiales bacterium]|nr:thiamine pyrophosphate-binding protein [Longimicrobiales bacterium]
MSMTGGSIVLRALEDEGISLAFGIPGTHNIELYDALAQSTSVRSVLVTDEQSASFMADAVWRASGQMACVNVVPGAGLTHALSGIAEAFMDHVPMLVLGCGIRRDTGKAFQLHDIDQRSIVAPVVKGTFLPTSGQELYGMLRQACALARAGAPGPVFVEVPVDLYLFTHDVSLPKSGGPAAAPRPEPDPALLQRAVGLVRQARRPLIHVGAGAAGAAAEVLALAELLEAPVSTTFQGKGVFPERHPLFLWPGFGPAAPPFARKVASSCDLTLAIGCRFSEVGTASYGLEPPGPLVHVDIDADALGRNYPAEVAVVADARAFVRGLLEEMKGGGRPGDAKLREQIRVGHAEVRDSWMKDVGGDLVTPAHLLGTAQKVFGPEAIFTTDSGNGTFLAMECLRLEGPGKFLAPVDYSCMGYAVPAALGAKLAKPESPVVALAGDGAFLMTGLELLTAAKEGLGVVVLVLRDRELAQIAQFQETAMNRKTASQVHDYDVAGLAAGLRIPALSLGHDDHVEGVLVEADRLARRGSPVLVDVAIDYGRKTYFTQGVVKTNLHRLPLKDQVRFVARAVVRKFTE